MRDTHPEVAGGDTYERPAIAGSGTIATGLAACATIASKVLLLARSDASAWRAEEQAHSLCAKLEGGDAKRVKVTTAPADLADCDLVVEAVIEELEPKAELFRSVGEAAGDADLATTTSSLSIDELASAGGHPDRTFGLHPFNPVVRMELIELCLPEAARAEIAGRARTWCESIGKTVVEVPNEPGFVVNRLLFPYLFDAVRLMEQTGMEPEEVDRCMTLGANYPMGPLALLDLIGADVAVAIGEALYADSQQEHHRPPGRLVALVDRGKLGRKSGAGFYEYD
ncbi:MAG TPA: 3-hydroxyacyl-CoA dehydrogenase family protein [Solirubrobacterales bacterium]|nr:3-hydroxyacyl-CoA dehydrogenase family protein [Solirubrobacterales bacterium]